MTIQQLFITANSALKHVINQIADDQWDIEMPAGLTSKPATLRQSVNYHGYDDAWVPDVLAGRTKEEVGDVYDGILTTMDTKATYATYSQVAIDAVAAVTDLATLVHLSYGDFSVQDYLRHITLFRALRSYDIAKLIGTDAVMAPDFAQALYDEYAPLADEYRQYGILPAALPIDENMAAQAKLLALVGRE
jgi:hypothetical protein